MPIIKEERDRRKQVRRRWQLLRRLRQLIQYLALALFLYLFVRTTREGGSPIPVDLFARLDPLLALSSMLAARSAIPTFAPAIITVLATLALGRVWCGWICPLGTVLDLFGTNVREAVPERFRRAKYFLLFVVIVAALLASLPLMWLDPITVLLSPLAGAVHPAMLRRMATAAASPFLQPAVYPLLASPLLIILGLNLVARRFWCRYLCPLGALVALLSKFSWLRRCVADSCRACEQCVAQCPMDTISGVDFSSDPGECLQCLNCHARCADASLTFKGGWSPGFGYEYDPSRRQFLASLATGAAWAGLLKTGLLKTKNPYPLRPPGAREEEFLTRCVRCGECIKICPENALRLAPFEAGLEGVSTPMLVPRLGYCDYSCNACGQVCPSGAIPPLSLEEKRKAVIGTAVLAVDRCVRCMVCEYYCPVGAIERVEVEGKTGTFPKVAPERCIGCGLCEYRCPVEGEAAIRVYAPGALG
ncbi:MAG TPA: 4Fe-4S dicluster domain-containing protein [Anaerolineae bacterium]|nr:4Fe-4S dicluster domain-containing protein [Anaerolineae bacterium]